MAPSAYEATLAGLLHDIGKLYQRANWSERKPHTAWTESFVLGLKDQLAGIGINPEGLAHAASHHHERVPAGYQPDNPLSWAVTLADNYASKEREEKADPGEKSSPPTVPLTPVFERVTLNEYVPGNSHYALGPLDPTTPFPSKKQPPLTYVSLQDRLGKFLTLLAKHPPSTAQALLASLNAAFAENAWAVPSDTQSEPDVSLYDHLRLTAAFAGALWRYHEEVDGQITTERLRDQQEQKFLLVSGDIGGIQKHIYRIREAASGTGGIAKRLRARSLGVALATESMAHEVLNDLGLTFLNRVMSAGGRFTLLVQNTKQAITKLEELRSQWQTWAINQGATLVPFLAWAPFSPASIGGAQSFGKLLEDLALSLSEEKLRPYAHAAIAAPSFAMGNHSLYPCPVCDSQPSQGQDGSGAWLPCKSCESEAVIGARLPGVSKIALLNSEPEEPYFAFPGTFAKPETDGDFVYRSLPEYEPGDGAFEVRPLVGRIPTVADAEMVSGLPHDDWLNRQNLSQVLEELGASPKRPLTFEEIAYFSRGAKHLGVLMLDADRMGEVFSTGLTAHNNDLRTPSRVATLSRMLEYFFGFVTVRLMSEPSSYAGSLPDRPDAKSARNRYPLIYSVYAGGDDVFLIGPWDVLLHYALDLEYLYKKYTANNPAFTLSGGFILAKPHTPMPSIADRAQEAEKLAKKAGRNRLTLFGHPATWEKVESLLARGAEFYQLLEGNELPSGTGHKLLGLWNVYLTWSRQGDTRGLRYKPMLYYMQRNSGVKTHWSTVFAPLMNHKSPEMELLPVWVQYALYLRR